MPIRVWLADEEGYNLMKTELESDLAKKFFNTEELVKLLDDHKAGRDDNEQKNLGSLCLFGMVSGFL